MKKIKKRQTNFSRMCDEEKKNFLSMDLIERMIRVEQRVALSFGKKISYNKTEYYKGLKNYDKKCFENYLRKEKRRKFLLYGFLVLILFGFVFFEAGLTGKAVENTLKELKIFNLVEEILAIVLLVFVLGFIIGLIYKKIKNLRFENHFKVLEDIYLNKRTIKHF